MNKTPAPSPEQVATGNKRRVTIIAACVALAAPMEGLRQVAYYDPPGVLTVCYGSTNNVDPKKVYTLQECKARLGEEMSAAVDTAMRCAPGAPDGVIVAFSDTVFNAGPKIACDRTNSTAARMLYVGNWAGACDQLPRWDKARVGGVLVALPGLTKRRAAARLICRQGL